MSSETFFVKSIRDGKVAEANFKEGELINYSELTEKEYQKLTGHDFNGETGTIVGFIPDKKVFQNMNETFSFERICNEIKNISYLNKGIHFIIEAEDGRKQEYYSKNGIADFIKDNVSKPLMKAPIISFASDGIDELEIAFIYTSGPEQFHVFVNGLYCPQGGTPVTGAKTTITNSIKRLSGKNFDPELIRKGLVYAINCKVSNPSFANQTKSKINNPNLRTLASQAFKKGFEEFSRTADFIPIIEMMTKYQKAEQAADRAREVILNQNKEIDKELKKKTVLAGKLADCRYHDDKSQLLIVEGLSALGSIIKSRNSDYTAAIPLTGKILNVLKSTDDKQCGNEVLKNIHTALGCGYGENFNIKKLRYGRIVFVADMDEDGFSIMCLLLSLFYRYYPQVITAGKVFWGQTPLFKVISGKKTYYAYNERELAKLPKGDITRAKGIGELEAEDFRATLFSENGHYIKFLMNDVENAVKYFDILMGDNIQERKKYISENADFDAFD